MSYASEQGVLNAQHNAAVEAQISEVARRAPSALFRPSLSVDGDQWCALYGDNLQDGVAGFGASPEEAMADFDRAWCKPLDKPSSPALDNMMGRNAWPAFMGTAGGEG